MGAVFSMPLARVTTVDELPAPRVALVARRGEPLRGPLAAGTLLVGAERDGLPDEVVAACDVTVHIPIASESLNAATAASVALYECSREMAGPGTRVAPA
jgi:TrmH family RNA methyltransferase